MCLKIWIDHDVPPINSCRPHAMLCGVSKPISACSFVYKACEIDSSGVKKTPGVRELIALESFFFQ